MTTPVYNDGLFRLQFPAFADAALFPSQVLSSWWAMGAAYISTNNPGCAWTDAQAQLGNDLMAAHLAQIFTNINNAGSGGTLTGPVQSGTEGSVTVAMVPPPVKSAFGYWLAGTAYGQQLRALLQAVAGVGLYVGGSLERAAFRGAGGVW